MPAGFVKLYGSILDSSVWSEDPYTRLVWITMLAMADADGFVEAAIPGLARRANVPLDACEAALARLQAPDPYSKSPAHDGRRIQKAERGWSILNYQAYRELRTAEQAATAERQRRWRERHGVTRNVSNAGETKGSASPSASVSVPEGVQGEPRLPPSLPPADRAERAIRASTEGLRSRLYALVTEAEAVDPKHRDPTELIRLFTSYDKPDGTKVRGVVNAALLTHERLEKSIADAEWHLEQWRSERGA